MKKYNILILDCYNIFLRWAWNERNNPKQIKYNNKEINIEGVIAYVKAITHYIEKYTDKENSKIYFLFDNAQTTWERKQIYSQYKGCRKDLTESEYRQLDFCELISSFFVDNSYLFRVPKYEADDFVPNILRLYKKENDKVLLVSEDMDWSKWLSDDVEQYVKGGIMNKQLFEEKYGFEPNEKNVCFYKSFYGDKSDNIKGALNNFPKQFFDHVIKTYNNILTFTEDAPKQEWLDWGWKNKIEKEKNNLIANWNLVQSANIEDSELCTLRKLCTFRPNKLEIIYNTLGMVGVDNRIKKKEKSVEEDFFSILEGEQLERKQ